MDLIKSLSSFGVRLRLGGSIVARRRHVHWGSEPWLDIRSILKTAGRESGERPVIFDVGANTGQTVAEIRRWLKHATIHCFEPIPETFKILKQANCHARIHHMALGEESGSISMDTGGWGDLSTLARVVQSDDDEILGNVVDVPVETVDGMLERLEITKLGCLKMDVQGHELKVLEGAKESLRDHQIDLVIAEANVGMGGYPGQAPLGDLLDFLDPLGYRFVAFYSHVVATRLGCHHGDVLFMRDDIPVGNFEWTPLF